MEYLDSHERFALVQKIMQRYEVMGQRFAALMGVNAGSEQEAKQTIIRAVSVLDLMKAHLDDAIAEADQFDEDVFQMVNATKVQAMSELRSMHKALTTQIEYMDREIQKIKNSSKKG